VKRCARSALLTALACLLAACAHAPRLGEAADALSPAEHLRLGASYEAQGMRSDAAGQYEAAVRASPSCAECWLALGNLSFTEERLTEAEASYRKALEASPHHPGAANNLAMVTLARNGSLPEAEALALSALPNAGVLRPYVLDTLANIYLRQGRYADASAAIGQAEEAAPAYEPGMRAQLIETRKLINAAAAAGSAFK
jgi:tetratricopeptide (TPR) repeat protein